MKRVGVREFRDHATQYLVGDEVLAIERHGVPVGYYWPVGSSGGPKNVSKEVQEARQRLLQRMPQKGSKEAREVGERLERTVRGILDRTGHTEEEFARFFDLSVPIDQL